MDAIPVTQKKRGRPATGESPRVPVRFDPPLIAALDAYCEANGVNRSEAVRLIVRKGLTG